MEKEKGDIKKMKNIEKLEKYHSKLKEWVKEYESSVIVPSWITDTLDSIIEEETSNDEGQLTVIDYQLEKFLDDMRMPDIEVWVSNKNLHLRTEHTPSKISEWEFPIVAIRGKRS